MTLVFDIQFLKFFCEKENGIYRKTRFADRTFRAHMTRHINENISENFSL